ncbi:MAG: DUF167 domain-containing protein [Candidatus Omnitrophota bacterium]
MMPEIIRIEVIPDSNKNQIIKGEPLIVKVKEPATGGRANKAVVKLLSKYFSKRVRIISGGRNRRKVIQVYTGAG